MQKQVAHDHVESRTHKPETVSATASSYSRTSKMTMIRLGQATSLSLVLFLLLSYWNRLPSVSRSVKVSPATSLIEKYFDVFRGVSECSIHAVELYSPPQRGHTGFYEPEAFCRTRYQLLQALNDGGRVGFGSPYAAKGCDYKWFSVEEICFILDRLGGLVFIGDESLRTVYNGFNILLRQDLAFGAMNLDSIPEESREGCRCNNQFTKEDCRQYYIMDSASLTEHSIGSKFYCAHLHHGFLKIDSKDPSASVLEEFKDFVPRAPRSAYKPIPIIHSLSPATVPVHDAIASLTTFTRAADESDRNTPILWLGPTAAGHIRLKGGKGDQEIWDFDRTMTVYARENDVEVLGMWNMTVQASSWDGIRFGEGVAITQAMMVLNWLSRIESS